MERDCESELSKLNIEQNACIYHFGASVIHGQRSNILRLRLVRYKEGAEMYSMGMNKFQTLAKDARAILKIDRMVLVDLDIFDEYLETFRV